MNKVCLVTGSGRGIGRACIKEFAKNGYDVVINYVQDEISANSLKEEVEKNYNVKALTVKCDISNEIEVKKMVEEIITTLGRIDVLVNNAGIAIDTVFEDKKVENFRKILDVNLIGQFITAKEVGKYMMNVKKGAIINISSTNGIDTLYPESLDYDASKAGVISLTKNLATVYHPYIRVNSVAPGWVLTDMNKELDSEFVKEEKNKILLNRFAEPEEIAKVVYFLSTDDASYINGETIKVDGGSF